MIRYSVVQGEIPEGSRIISDRGVMKIVGVIPLDPSVNPPTFTSTKDLGVISEKIPMSITLAAQAHAGKTLENASIIGGFLPWGLRLSGLTISGTPAELLTKDVADFLPGDAPVWETRDGILLEEDEFAEVDIALAATPKAGSATFNLVSGGLPWGLKLFADGTISGTLTEDRSGAPVTSPLPPIWDTAKGQLAVLDEMQVVSDLSVSAFSRTDKPIRYFVLTGALPWGLKLDSMSGVFQGRVLELQIGGADENPATQIKPSLPSGTVSARIGIAYSSTLVPVIPEGRSLMSLDITAGNLPLGIQLRGNQIVGTPLYAGTGSFDITVIDSAFSKSNTTFNFEVSV